MALNAVPGRRGRLSGGALVRASILARVLGMRILTLDTTLVLVPAEINDPSSVPDHRTPREAAGSSLVASTRSGAAGRGLAEAIQSLEEGAELLASSRRGAGAHGSWPGSSREKRTE